MRRILQEIISVWSVGIPCDPSSWLAKHPRFFAENEGICFSLAQLAEAPLSLLAHLADEKSVYVRRQVASHPALTAEILEKLAIRGDDDVRCAVADHVNTSAFTIATLAKSQYSVAVRCAAIRHPRIAPEILSTIATDPHKEVRRSVAANPRTPLQTLQLLAAHEDSETKALVAGNPATTPEMLRVFAQSRYRPVRVIVAQHPNTPADVIEMLKNDVTSEVRGAVGERVQKV